MKEKRGKERIKEKERVGRKVRWKKGGREVKMMENHKNLRRKEAERVKWKIMQNSNISVFYID